MQAAAAHEATVVALKVQRELVALKMCFFTKVETLVFNSSEC